MIDGGVQVARQALASLKRRFSGDPEAERAIERVADAPDSAKRQQALAALLEARADQSADIRAELEAIVGQFAAVGVRTGNIEQVAEGDRNVQNAGIVNSQITIQGEAPGPTG